MRFLSLPPASSLLPGLAMLALAVIDITTLHLLAPADRALGDAMSRIAARSVGADRDIIVVDIDDRSLEAMASDAFGVGRFPWPRAVYGELVDEMRRQKARAVVFDIELYEPDVRNPQSDAVLNAALDGSTNTFFPIKSLARIARDEGVWLAKVAPSLALSMRGPVDADARATLELPFALDKSAWPRTGLIDFLADADGVGRRYWIAQTIGGYVIPSLPARVAKSLGYTVPEAESIRLAWMRGGEFPHPRVAFVDLYEDIQRGKRERPRDEFTDRIVVVGASATHLGDHRTTPIAALRAYVAEQRAKEQRERVLGRFLDHRLVKRLVGEGVRIEDFKSELRTITVLFSDIRGFTSLAETRPPEDVVALLNDYLSRQSETVFRHGGTLDKFIGDAIMAFWNAPTDDAHHAEHAIDCAVAMIETLARFNAETARSGTQLDIGVGVHTGPAVVGFIGSRRKLEYTAIGDTVNLASRIEGETRGRSRILLSSATRERVTSRAFVEVAVVSVKGRAQSVLYTVEGLQ